MSDDQQDYSTAAALMGQPKRDNQATKQPRLQPSNQATSEEDMVEVIRKAIKQLGKETTSYRLHETEKETLADILYRLKKQDLKSSENEIIRIAVNYILEDYNTNKKDSILVKVLESLKA